MKIQRKYKQIDENRRLDEKESGIPAIANDEVFARLIGMHGSPIMGERLKKKKIDTNCSAGDMMN